MFSFNQSPHSSFSKLAPLSHIAYISAIENDDLDSQYLKSPCMTHLP